MTPEEILESAMLVYLKGLGILAGDHLKASSDLGVPLVGIGLFYRHGYFRQGLDHDGWQTERFPDQDPWAMPLTRCEGVRVQVELAGTPLVAQVWRADVGRVDRRVDGRWRDDRPGDGCPDGRGLRDEDVRPEQRDEDVEGHRRGAGRRGARADGDGHGARQRCRGADGRWVGRLRRRVA